MLSIMFSVKAVSVRVCTTSSHEIKLDQAETAVISQVIADLVQRNGLRVIILQVTFFIDLLDSRLSPNGR